MTDLRFGSLGNYRDLFVKLHSDVEAFSAAPSDYSLFNAMVTAWSLADWVREDIELTPEMDGDLLALTGRDSKGQSQWPCLCIDLQICKDIANGSKHAIIRRYTPEVRSVSFSDGSYGSGPYGMGPYGGSSLYAVQLGNAFYSAQDALEHTIARFEDFFKKYDRR